MEEKPIALHAYEVLGLLNHGILQIRRAINPQPVVKDGWAKWGKSLGATGFAPKVITWNVKVANQELGTAPIDTCGFYQPNDVLWVQEAYDLHGIGNALPVYRVDSGQDGDGATWRAATQMTKEYSRCGIRVIAVRAIRLWNYSDLDLLQMDAKHVWDAQYRWNAHNAHPWSSNPWVWAYTFERIEVPA